MNGILRPGLLDGVSVLVATPAPVAETPAANTPAANTPVARFVASLGASVTGFAPELDDAGEGGAEWVRERMPLHALVFDSCAWRPPEDGRQVAEPLRDLLDAAWIATAAVANGAFIPGGAGGRIIFIAPADRSSTMVPAATAGLENLARTLSVEWARHEIGVSCLAPSVATAEQDLGSIVAFLLSRAGAYFSGSRLDLNSLSR